MIVNTKGVSRLIEDNSAIPCARNAYNARRVYLEFKRTLDCIYRLHFNREKTLNRIAQRFSST